MKLKKALAAAISTVLAVGFINCMPQTETFEPLTVKAANYSEQEKYGDFLYYQKVDEDDNGTYEYIIICDCDKTVTEIEIPSEIEGMSVTGIGANAFASCLNLVNVTIPESVKSIGDDAFRDSSALLNIYVAEGNTTYYSIDGVLFNEESELVAYPIGRKDESYKIPESVKYIGYNAFYNCSNLVTLEIPGNVKHIDIGAFLKCYNLTNVTIDDGLRIIDQAAFSGCISLKNITLPASVIAVRDFAFDGCVNLESITIENPECVITDKEYTISNDYDSQTDTYCYNGIIYGYTNSTAQDYADKYGRKFVALDNEPIVTTTTTTTTTAITTETTVSTTVTSVIKDSKNYVGSCELKVDINTNAEVGDTVQVPIYAETYGHTIYAMGAMLEYDKTALKLTDFIVPDEAGYEYRGFENSSINYNKNNGSFIIKTYDENMIVNCAEYPIIIVEFKVLDGADGVYEINLKNQLGIDSDVEIVKDTYPEISYLETVTISGTITVGGTSDVPEKDLGDANGDDEITVADIVIIQKALVKCEPNTEITLDVVDLNKDGKFNVFDFIVMIRFLIDSQNQL